MVCHTIVTIKSVRFFEFQWTSIFFARDGLIKKDLIAFDGYLFQVLSLPEKPVLDPCEPLRNLKETQKHDPATIRRLIDQCFGRKKHD